MTMLDFVQIVKAMRTAQKTVATIRAGTLEHARAAGYANATEDMVDRTVEMFEPEPVESPNFAEQVKEMLGPERHLTALS